MYLNKIQQKKYPIEFELVTKILTLQRHFNISFFILHNTKPMKWWKQESFEFVTVDNTTKITAMLKYNFHIIIIIIFHYYYSFYK